MRRRLRRTAERDPVVRRRPDDARTNATRTPATVLRQRAGNTGLNQLAQVIHRQPAPGTPADLDAPPPTPVESLTDTIVAIVEPIIAALVMAPPKDPKRPLTPELVLKQAWPDVRVWMMKLGTKKAIRLPANFRDLDVPEITDALRAMREADRKAVADAVVDHLVANVGSETPETYRAEFAKLDENVVSAIEPSADPIVGYVAMREGLKETFGSIDALNTHFKGLVKAGFPPIAKKVVGQQSLVHPQLRTALDRAVDLLKKRGKFADVVASISEVTTIKGKKHRRGSWAISIRENRNNPSEIGNHSFGFAIDIDADFNQNFQKFDWSLIEKMTGFDVRSPADLAATRPGQPFDKALVSAGRFRAASDAFKASFKTEAAFQAALANMAAHAGIPVDAAKLLAAVKAAGQGGRAAAPAMLVLQSLLREAMQAELDRKAREGPHAAEEVGHKVSAQVEAPIVITIVANLRRAVKGRADLDKLMPQIQAQLMDPKEKRPQDVDKRLAFLFSKSIAREIGKLAQPIREREAPASVRVQLGRIAQTFDVTDIAKAMVTLHGAFATVRAKPDKIGVGTSLPSVAMHGFMNLHPELIAALTSSEGGGLTWLGSTMYTKDWMHFQLRNPPKITKSDGPWP